MGSLPSVLARSSARSTAAGRQLRRLGCGGSKSRVAGLQVQKEYPSEPGGQVPSRRRVSPAQAGGQR